MDLKWLSLLLFMCQNSVNPIIFRYATTESSAEARYSTTVAIWFTELLKCLVSFLLVLAEEGFSIPLTCSVFYNEVIMKPAETLTLGVPAGLYALQNTLLQLSSGHLPAAVWQVIYQGKLLVTAIMSVILLRKQFRRAQWLAMGVMGLGIAAVQLSNASEKAQATMGNAAEQNFVTGTLLLLVACFCSGFASVYFERIVKKKSASVWVQNVQLAMFTMLLCSYGFVEAAFFPSAGGGTSASSALHGFTLNVWLLILNNTIGGLLVALVIKHADNILRGFASSFATILCSVISVFCFGFQFSFNFLLGTLLVLGSALLYGGILNLPGDWWNAQCEICMALMESTSGAAPTPAKPPAVQELKGVAGTQAGEHLDKKSAGG